MAYRIKYGNGIDLENNDILDVLFYGVDTDALAQTYLSTTKRKYVYHAESGGRIMYRGESGYKTLATSDDIAALPQTFVALPDTPANYTGAGGKVLVVNSGATAVEFVTSLAKAQQHSTTVYTDQANTFGDSDQSFRSSRLIIRNPANTQSYNFIAAAISASRSITLPLLTGNDTMVTEAFAQTLTNKTLSAANNSIVDSTNAAGDILKNNGTKYVRFARSATTGHVLKSTAGDLEWNYVAWSEVSGKPTTFTPAAHAFIDTVNHTVSGLTSGHFLKATGATTYAFGAHGLTTSDISEGTKLYFTDARVRAVTLTGFNASPSSTILAADTILAAFGKAQAQINTLAGLVQSGVAWRPPVDLVFNTDAAQLTTTTNTIDSVTVTAGMRVLVIDSSNVNQDHKIYLSSGSASNWVWTVQQDNTGADLPTEGHTVWVGRGTLYGDKQFTFNSTLWVLSGGVAIYTSGTGISISGGNQISLATHTALSVLGVAGNSDAVPLAITAGTDGYIMRRSGTSIGFGQIVNAGVSDTAAIALTKLAAFSNTKRVLYSNASGNFAEMDAGTAHQFLRSDGSNIPAWSSYSMPTAVAGDDVGKFVVASAANVLSMATLTYAMLPYSANFGTVGAYYLLLSSAAKTATVTAGTHGFSKVLSVTLWRLDSTTYRPYNIDFSIDGSNNVSAESENNWPVNSYLMVSGIKLT